MVIWLGSTLTWPLMGGLITITVGTVMMTTRTTIQEILSEKMTMPRWFNRKILLLILTGTVTAPHQLWISLHVRQWQSKLWRLWGLLQMKPLITLMLFVRSLVRLMWPKVILQAGRFNYAVMSAGSFSDRHWVSFSCSFCARIVGVKFIPAGLRKSE